MLTMFVRALVLYVMVVIVMRAMGKRQIGQMQPYELTVTIMIADLAAAPISDVSIPLAYGLLPIAALVLMEAVLSIITFKSEKARTVITGRPSVVVTNGVINEQELKKLCLNLNDLMEQIRVGGLLNINEVGAAVLETSGEMSVFPISQKRPLSPQDMGVVTQHEGIPLMLIEDGRIQSNSIEKVGLDEEWLHYNLRRMGVTEPKKLLLCTLNSQNIICAQEKDTGAMHYITAKKKEEKS